MLGNATKAIVGLIATVMIGIFAIGLAESISSGFAGFYGGLPFWIIVIFVMSLAVYDYLDECLEVGETIKFYFQVAIVAFMGTALAYGSWGTSTLFEGKEEIMIRSRLFDNYTAQAIWFEVFWMAFTFVVAATTVTIVMRMIERRKQSISG